MMDVNCESKTADSVFCNITIVVTFRVMVENSYDAYYRLINPQHQIRSCIFDVIRGAVPRLTMDELFRSKTDITTAVMKGLENVMAEYGYEIIQTLVTNIKPDDYNMQSMTEVNVAKRIKAAMVHKAEAGKFLPLSFSIKSPLSR